MTRDRLPTEVQANMAWLIGIVVLVLLVASAGFPTKALSIPLLRQELEGMKTNYQRDIESYNKQIDRIYDQNKWFIGLMFSMAVGLIGSP